MKIEVNQNCVHLMIDQDDVIKHYIESCLGWIEGYQKDFPPHPYVLLDSIVKDIAHSLSGSFSKGRYYTDRDSTIYHWANRSAEIFNDPFNGTNPLYYHYVVETRGREQLEFSTDGDFFHQKTPSWNRPVFEYRYTKLVTKERHEIIFQNVQTNTNDKEILQGLEELKSKCPCNPRYYHIINSRYTSFLCYKCPLCGRIYLCACFEQVKELWDRKDYHWHQEYEPYAESLIIRRDICHVCRGSTPPSVFIHKMYASFFMQRYAPWVYKDLAIKSGHLRFISLKSMELREAENDFREHLGTYRIGEKWINETSMFYSIKEICGDKFVVVHHARPAFLNGQEYDVYIPDLKLAFEYDGLQHEQPVMFFGGETSLAKTKERDRIKNQISEHEGVTSVRINETSSEHIIENEIVAAIKALE